VIRENTYNVVPLSDVVWEAWRRELGDPVVGNQDGDGELSGEKDGEKGEEIRKT
jgi:hypothetical protein